MEAYNPKEIEAKWQEIWAKNEASKIDKDDKTREKFYILDMFPYPSGTGLHMGHTESYTASDAIYRFKKLQGFNVLHPQGFDSFGLPAENFAIKTGIHPAETTKKNMENYIRQMKSLGFGYDFDEQAVTSDPEYYKWTQWIFGEFFKNGLVYKKTSKTNWCSSCQTVIANEQVVEGKCERCGTEIEQKEVPSWFFKITDFAEELIQDLDKVDWPEYTKKNQRNWIGKSEGAQFKMQIEGGNEFIEVFTTRLDTVFGVTYVVVAPEHPVLENLKSKISNFKEVEEYIAISKNKTELDRMEAKEKTGIELEGVKVINPFNGESVPVFVADYVLGGYGTGAVMAVPAHDERDFEFARRYGLPIKIVIKPENDYEDVDQKRLEEFLKEIFSFKNENGFFAVLIGGMASKILNGDNHHISSDIDLFVDERGFEMISEYLSNKGYKKEILSKSDYGWNESMVRSFYADNGDWIDIFLIKKDKENYFDDVTGKIFKWGGNDNFLEKNIGGVDILLPKKDLLENVYRNITSTGNRCYTEDGVLTRSNIFNGSSSQEAREKMTAWLEEKGLGKKVVNYRLRDWSISRQRYWGCPIPIVYSPDGEPHLVPEEHLPWTLPEDVDFHPTGVSPLAKSEELKKRVEDIFGKGWIAEYDTMDTFVDSAWYFLRYPDAHNSEKFCSQERMRWLPVDAYIGGAEHTYMHLLFARFFVKALHKIGHLNFDEPFLKLRHQGMVLDKEGKKMSKSKGNVINPDDMVERFGADSVRTYMLFSTPLEDAVMWNEDNIVGVYRFLGKIWKIFDEKELVECGQGKCADIPKEIPPLFHKTVKKVTEDIESFNFNTAISAMMIFVNEISKHERLPKSAMERFLVILSPFAPHIAEELWAKLGHTESIFKSSWPKFNPEMIKDKEVNLVVQVNGKVRDTIIVSAEISEDEAKKAALESEKIKSWTEGKEIKKIIYVKNKLVSIVV